MVTITFTFKSCVFVVLINAVAYSQVLTPNSTLQTENSSLELKCTFSNDLSDQVNWKSRSFNAPSETDRISMWWAGNKCSTKPSIPPLNLQCSCRSREYTCVIKDITRQQDGEQWTCYPLNSDGDERPSNTVTLQIFIPIPNVIMTLPTTNVVRIAENSIFTFTCITAYGKPASTVTWYKSLGTSESNITTGITSSQGIHEDKTIQVTSLLSYTASRADHGSVVFCKATNGGDVVQSSRRPQLDIMYPPPSGPMIEGLTGSDVYKMIRGSSTQQQLTCSVTGGYPLPALSWNCYGGTQNESTLGSTVTRSVYWIAGSNAVDSTCNCTAASETGWSLSTSIQVSVLYSPSSPSCTVGFTSLTSGVIRVIKGRAFNISCSRSGNPSPTYTWSLPSGGSINYPDLSIPNLQTGGTYSLSIRNTMTPTKGDAKTGVADATFSIELLISPSVPKFYYGTLSSDPVIHNNSLVVIKGTQFSVTCVATGNPQPTYTWNGTSQTWSSTAQTNLNKTCSVVNLLNPTGYNSEQGISQQSILTISVFFPPGVIDCNVGSFKFTSGPVFAVQGTALNIRCDCTSFPAPNSYTWTLPDGGTQTGPELRVDSIQSTSQYRVIVNNIMVPSVGETKTGSNSTILDIQLLYPPRIKSGIRIQGDSSTSAVNDSFISTVENSTFTLSFDVTPGYPAATTFAWSRHSGGPSISNQNITFTIITRAQADFYNFTAVNYMNPTGYGVVTGKTSNDVYINVKYRSAITAFYAHAAQGNMTVEASEGTPLKLTCVTDSNPLPNITLTRNGAMIQQIPSVRQMEYNQASSSCENDMGEYSCLSQNELNPSTEKRTLRYYVLCKPRLSPFIQHLANVSGSLHSTANISVTMVAYPAPNYTWQKLNDSGWKEVETSARISIVTSDDRLQSNVIISEIREADFGSYRVIANNSQGGILIELYFQASSKPEPVRGLQYIEGSLKENSAVITWSPGFDGGKPQTFGVLIKKRADNEWSAPIETKEANMTLTGLQPGTEYQVKVISENSIGSSELSQPISFTTLKKEQPNLAPVIGGAIGGGIGAALIIVVVVLGVKKCRQFKGHSSGNGQKTRKQRLMNEENQHNLSLGDIPDEVENPSYISAGDVTASSTKPDAVYAQATKKKTQKPSEPMYSEPVKKNKKAIQIQEGATYAEVKKKPNDKQKKTSGPKNGAGEKKTSYDNTGFTETVYENHELERRNEIPKNVNKDGLIYADLDFPNQPQGQKRLVIHGLDDMTVYSEVDLTKKAEPLPESDTENPNKDK